MNHGEDLPRILRYEERDRARRLGGGPPMGELDRLRDDLFAAQRRYSDALRAFPPEYYREVSRPARERHGPMAAAPARPAVDEVMDHNYDGIQEYDNPTPGWWYAIFAGTIVFSLLYIMVYHSIVPPLHERHAAREAAALEAQFADLNRLPVGEEKILAIMGEPSWLARGESIFQGACVICHGPDGAGLVGPNLTDDNYRNIRSLTDIADLVTTGTANGAMPSQKNILNENEIALVAAYAASLRGKNLETNPAVNPDYFGSPIDPWPTPAE